MNPDRRRLLIPGLLVVLLVIVAIAGLVRRSDARTTPIPEVPSKQISVMTDPRITESSGLAASYAHPGIVYTFNDSGHAAQVFAVDIATGKVVGVTDVDGVTWHDAEAMALWGGKIFIGDIGTNRPVGTGLSMYVFSEPGPGNHHVTADRYPLSFHGKPMDFEAMAIARSRIDFYSKGWPNGTAYVLRPPLSKDKANIAYETRRTAPALTTDATASPDGRLILVRGSVVVEVRDAATWRLRYSDVIPVLRQGESITLERSGRSYLIGSEGKDSPLVRIPFDPTRVDAKAKPVDPMAQVKAQHPWRSLIWEHQRALVRTGIFGLVGVVVGFIAWRRVRRRRKEAAHGN
jgi:hypothetical protein